MISKLIRTTCATLGIVMLNACGSTSSDTSLLSFEKMNGFPTEDAGFLQGVSALYAGVLNGRLLIAGGCNFPDTPVAEGGKKVYYQDVYMAPLTTENTFDWKKVGRLPQAAAYGVTISTEKELVCIGGNTATESLSEVFLLSMQGDTLHTDALPSLPVTMDNMAGALSGQTIYVVGGSVDGVPSSAMYSLDLSALDRGWRQEASVPGPPRLQPVCAAQGGKIYVWGGFATASADRPASLSLDGYAYTPDTRIWTAVSAPCDDEGRAVSLGGGVAAPYGEDCILCAGGVDKDIFLKALQGIYAGKEYLTHPVEWYRFNRKLLVYHPQTDEWTVLGEFEQGARAGAALVSHEGFHYIINGELKPGIRTNEINRIKEQ